MDSRSGVRVTARWSAFLMSGVYVGGALHLKSQTLPC